MAEFLTSLSYVIASAAVCVTVSPFALLGLAPLCIMFVYVRRYYTSSARELKRLESVSRSPLYVDFQELLTGLVHLRTFGLEKRALRNFEAKVDENNRMFFHLHSLVPFNVLRMNGLAALFVSVMAAVVVVLGNRLETSLIGLGLSAAAGLIGRLHQTIRFSAEVENNFTSVERLQHFNKVPQEVETVETSDAPAPAASWPSKGEVVFEDVKLSYRPHLPLAAWSTMQNLQASLLLRGVLLHALIEASLGGQALASPPARPQEKADKAPPSLLVEDGRLLSL
ncbi:abcC8 [Symbiodinium sp. CCMP2592]|nr:abcC8 [Symbiodinium sp. CCMP2592]